MNILSFIKGATDGAVPQVSQGKFDLNRPVSELVQEIHETFYTEVDRLLVEVGIKEPVNFDTKAIEKKERLRKLGFVNTCEVKMASKQQNEMADVENRNKEKEALRQTILYFSQKYPMYKFITDEGVERICNKYNLVYGPVQNYLGEVPEKNLHEIENFKIHDDDRCVEFRTNRYERRIRHGQYSEAYKNLDAALDRYHLNYAEKDYGFIDINGLSMYDNRVGHYEFEVSPLEIAAPIKDFDTSNMVLSKNKLERKIEIPDPVVLQPVFHNGKKHYLIVTAWGDEASDPEVMNPIHN